MTTATASLLALSVCASTVVDGFRTDIDKFLGTKSTAGDREPDGTDLYTFKSDYTLHYRAAAAFRTMGERMSEEGSVLLKKNNGALPLTQDETQKITLLGFSSYYPAQGGDMGSSLVGEHRHGCRYSRYGRCLQGKGLRSEPDCGRYVRGPAAYLQVRSPELGRYD